MTRVTLLICAVIQARRCYYHRRAFSISPDRKRNMYRDVVEDKFGRLRFKIYDGKDDDWVRGEKLLREKTGSMLRRVKRHFHFRISSITPKWISVEPCPVIGCTPAEFERHISAQFRPGMTWQNHGIEWELDHIQPVCTFDLGDKEQFNKCAHYTNLRPLTPTENRGVRINTAKTERISKRSRTPFKPRVVRKNGTKVWEIDLRGIGKGRVFGPTKRLVLLKKKRALFGVEFEPPVKACLPESFRPLMVMKNRQPQYYLDLRRSKLGRIFASTREQLFHKWMEKLRTHRLLTPALESALLSNQSILINSGQAWK